MSEQREEIRRIVAGVGEPMSAAQIFEQAKSSDDRAAFSVMLSGMAKAGEIAKHPAPAGIGQGVRFVYGPLATEPGHGTPDANAKRKHARATFNRMQGAVREITNTPMTPSKTAKKRSNGARTQRSTDRARRLSSRGARTKVQPAAANRATTGRISGAGVTGTRWALTNDGEFILVGTSIEIPQPAARALVEFVRLLDKGAA